MLSNKPLRYEPPTSELDWERERERARGAHTTQHTPPPPGVLVLLLSPQTLHRFTTGCLIQAWQTALPHHGSATLHPWLQAPCAR